MSTNPTRSRRRFTAEFKAEVALAALQEREPLAALAVKYTLTPAQIATWKQQLKQQAAQVFSASTPPPEAAVDLEALYAQLGRLQMENALLKKTLAR